MKKIMFSDAYGLTESVLSGRKTQTRRIVSERLWDRWTDYEDFCNSVGVGDIPTTCQYYKEEDFFLDNSPYKVGEVVAVAQPYVRVASGTTDWLTENWEPKPEFEAGWNNKLFVRAALMPHQIRITNVRVERLNEISESDCLAGGVELSQEQYKYDGTKSYFVHNLVSERGSRWNRMFCKLFDTPREAYAALIDRISGKGTWLSNPWVFAYDFELVK